MRHEDLDDTLFSELQYLAFCFQPDWTEFTKQKGELVKPIVPLVTSQRFS